MTEKYSKLLVTKLSPSAHEKLKKLAENDRRALSALSRIIIEDYMDDIDNISKKMKKANLKTQSRVLKD
jgi:predicted DNA-binding protein